MNRMGVPMVSHNQAKERIVNLFGYIKEIKNRLEKSILDESEYDWCLNLDKLPNHPYVFKQSTEDYFFKIKRPKKIECPEPPEKIVEWIKPSWRDIDKDLEYLTSKNIEHDDGSVETIFIKDFPDIMEKIKDWEKIREDWKEAEKPSEEVRAIFSLLHDAKSIIEKDDESNQLCLTDGVLVQSHDDLHVKHPLVYKEVGVELVSNISEPEILITKSDADTSIFMTVLRSLEVNGKKLGELKKEFSDLDIDPDDDNIESFFQKLVHGLWKNGSYSEKKVAGGEHPIVYKESKLIISKRESSFSEQIDDYIEKIKDVEFESLPIAYQNIVGFFPSNNETEPQEHSGQHTSTKKRYDYFLTKDYNAEQKRIIDRLDKHGCVSVQGPPGTGKSHTIANLIGHLLAKGESALVSSHRSKALEVVRSQVSEELRSMCVSVLDDQKINKEQLEKSVNYLTGLTASKDKTDISKNISSLKKRREGLIKDIEFLEGNYLKCISNEYLPISYQGSSYSPKQAAQMVSENISFSLIKGSMESDVPPVSNQDWLEIKKIISEISVESQKIIENKIPDYEKIIKPEKMQYLTDKVKNFREVKKNINTKAFNLFQKENENDLNDLREEIKKISPFFDPKEEYLEAMLDKMFQGKEYEQDFKKFVEKCQRLVEDMKPYSHPIFKYNPSLTDEQNILQEFGLDALIETSEKLHAQTTYNVHFGFFRRLNKTIKNNAKIQGENIKTIEELNSFICYLKRLRDRKVLSSVWDSLVLHQTWRLWNF